MAEVGRRSPCSEIYHIGFQLRAILEQETVFCEPLQFGTTLYFDPTIGDHLACADILGGEASKSELVGI